MSISLIDMDVMHLMTNSEYSSAERKNDEDDNDRIGNNTTNEEAKEWDISISVQPPIEAASDAGTPAVEPCYGLILAGTDSDIGDANCDCGVVLEGLGFNLCVVPFLNICP